jgi:hypothetical protein
VEDEITGGSLFADAQHQQRPQQRAGGGQQEERGIAQVRAGAQRVEPINVSEIPSDRAERDQVIARQVMTAIAQQLPGETRGVLPK